MTKAFIIVAQAGVAAATLTPRVVHTLATADPNDRAQCLRKIRDAAEQTRELLTRLEIAELELAAIPHTDGEEEAA